MTVKVSMTVNGKAASGEVEERTKQQQHNAEDNVVHMQAADLEPAAAVRLEQAVGHDAGGQERQKERKRAEDLRLLVDAPDLPVVGLVDLAQASAPGGGGHPVPRLTGTASG